jgi:hypothetical protein
MDIQGWMPEAVEIYERVKGTKATISTPASKAVAPNTNATKTIKVSSK